MGQRDVQGDLPGREIWGHANIVDGWEHENATARELVANRRPDWADDVAPVEFIAPDHLVTNDAMIDLGDRVVSLRHPGRGHTDNDLVVVVDDADVVFAGDIVEESGPPAYGDDSFPLEWPATNARLLAWITPTATVVPGHGDVIDRPFVEEQNRVLAAVEHTIRDLYAAGVAADAALAAGDWPFPRAHARRRRPRLRPPRRQRVTRIARKRHNRVTRRWCAPVRDS